MSQRTQVFVYPKNTDLDSFSAKQAINHLLEYQELVKLKRYTLWQIYCEEGTDWLDHLLGNTFTLINHNKEGFSRELSEAVQDPKIDRYFTKVDPKVPSDYQALSEKISHTYQLNNVALEKSIVWELHIKKTSDPVQDRDRLKRKVLVTSHFEEGLLVNPLSESYQLMNEYEFSKQYH